MGTGFIGREGEGEGETRCYNRKETDLNINQTDLPNDYLHLYKSKSKNSYRIESKHNRDLNILTPNITFVPNFVVKLHQSFYTSDKNVPFVPYGTEL